MKILVHGFVFVVKINTISVGEHKGEQIQWLGRGLPNTFPTQPFPMQFFYLAVSEFCPFIINQ